MQTVKARLIVKNVKVENLPTKRKNHRVNHAPKGHGATKKDWHWNPSVKNVRRDGIPVPKVRSLSMIVSNALRGNTVRWRGRHLLGCLVKDATVGSTAHSVELLVVLAVVAAAAAVAVAAAAAPVTVKI
jgi:hypothetical protein